MYSTTKTHQRPLHTAISLFVLFIAIAFAAPLRAQQFFDQQEPFKSGFTLHVDNDLFVGSDLDQDYTGGVGLTFSGRQAISSFFSIDGARAKLDRLTRFNRTYASNQVIKLHALEAGFVMFTPSDLSIAAAQPGERPYASLFFLSNNQQVVAPGLILQKIFIPVPTTRLAAAHLRVGIIRFRLVANSLLDTAWAFKSWWRNIDYR